MRTGAVLFFTHLTRPWSVDPLEPGTLSARGINGNSVFSLLHQFICYSQIDGGGASGRQRRPVSTCSRPAAGASMRRPQDEGMRCEGSAGSGRLALGAL
jgi:hypothetical protein